MSFDYQPQLDWIAQQSDAMLQQTLRWSAINSGSYHLDGLMKMADVLAEDFAVLGAEVERLQLEPMESVNDRGEVITIPLGEALRFTKRPDAPLRVLLTGHMDTVFPKDHAFQTCTQQDANTWNGPGLADMKGGLCVALHALQALEQSPWADKIGWQIIINPDEEIGSHGSAPLLAAGAKANHLGLTYEPSLPDGTLAGARKGSGNFTAVVRGRSAHAGREPEKGRNAIAALAEYITAIFALNGGMDGVTVNPGKLEGGGPVNVVPDLAICRFNIRIGTPEEQAWVEQQLAEIQAHINAKDGFSLELHGGFTRPPKVLSPANEHLFDLLKTCGQHLGVEIKSKATGGCCDGNNLAAHGLPNVDTLGVRGGQIHSAEEYMLADSLPERAQLSALLLMKLASGEAHWPHVKQEATVC